MGVVASFYAVVGGVGAMAGSCKAGIDSTNQKINLQVGHFQNCPLWIRDEIRNTSKPRSSIVCNKALANAARAPETSHKIFRADDFPPPTSYIPETRLVREAASSFANCSKAWLPNCVPPQLATQTASSVSLASLPEICEAH